MPHGQTFGGSLPGQDVVPFVAALLQCFQRQTRLGIQWADTDQERFVAEAADALPAEPVRMAKVVRMLGEVSKCARRISVASVVTALRTSEFWVKIAASKCVTHPTATDVKELAKTVFPDGVWPTEIARRLVIERNSPLASFFTEVVHKFQ